MWKPLCCCHCNKNNTHSVPTFTSEKKKRVISQHCEPLVHCVALLLFRPHFTSVTDKILEINVCRKRFMLVCSGPAITLIRLQQHSCSNLQNWCCYLPVVHLQGRWPEMTACTQTAAAMRTKKWAPRTDNTHQLCLSGFSQPLQSGSAPEDQIYQCKVFLCDQTENNKLLRSLDER